MLAELGGFIDKGQWLDLSNKSLVLPKHAEESHRRFPEMDYVLLVEPDMYPVASSFNRAALQQREVVYAIRRSGKESLGERLADSVFRNDGNWYFKFRVHESPFYRRSDGTAGVPEHISDTGWSVVEITGSSRDGQARHHRIREELRLVEEDLKDFPGLPRLTYYAGVLRYDLAMAADATRAATVTLGREAVKILQRRAKDAGKSQEEKQQRSAAAYFCGRAYLDVLGQPTKAEKWFKKSIQLEKDFLYAHVALIQMLFQQTRHQEAFDQAVLAERLGPPQLRLFMDSGPLHVCDIPLLLSKAIYYGYSNATLKPQILNGSAWQRRDALLTKCESHCPTAAAETASRKMHDIGKLKEFWLNENVSCQLS